MRDNAKFLSCKECECDANMIFLLANKYYFLENKEKKIFMPRRNLYIIIRYTDNVYKLIINLCFIVVIFCNLYKLLKLFITY